MLVIPLSDKQFHVHEKMKKIMISCVTMVTLVFEKFLIKCSLINEMKNLLVSKNVLYKSNTITWKDHGLALVKESKTLCIASKKRQSCQ